MIVLPSKVDTSRYQKTVPLKDFDLKERNIKRKNDLECQTIHKSNGMF